MKKPKLLLGSIVICLLMFFLLLYLFIGMKSYFVSRFQPEYITPNTRDSLYMELVPQASTRDAVIEIGETVEGFYFMSDSIKTILDANIGQEIISDILIEKGMANKLRLELAAMDSSTLLLCEPPCLDSIYSDKLLWDSLFVHTPPVKLKEWINQKINFVVNVEKEALRKIKEENTIH